MTGERIGVPRGTQLKAVFRGEDCWEVWIAVKDVNMPYSKWVGSFLQLYDNGAVERWTIEEDGNAHVLLVKPEDGDRSAGL